MADSEVVAEQEELEEPEELSHEKKKEEEQAVIQQQIEQTEAQLERLDKMGPDLKDMTLQELAVTFHILLLLVMIRILQKYCIKLARS